MRFLAALAVTVLCIATIGLAPARAQEVTQEPTATPDGQWCYHFDFSEGPQGFSAPFQGEYSEFDAAFRTAPNEWGALGLEYTHPITVFPSHVTVILERYWAATGNVDVSIEGDAFGLAVTPSPTQFTWPSDSPQRSHFVINPLAADNFSPNFSLFISSSQHVLVTDIFVYGFGVSPFEIDNCTPNPAEPSPTPTATPIDPPSCLLPGQPTPTPTQSGQPTPTPAPQIYRIGPYRVTFGPNDWGTKESSIVMPYDVSERVKAVHAHFVFSTGTGVSFTTGVADFDYLYSPMSGTAGPFRFCWNRGAAENPTRYSNTALCSPFGTFDATGGFQAGYPHPVGATVPTRWTFSQWANSPGATGYVDYWYVFDGYPPEPPPTPWPNCTPTPTMSPTPTPTPLTPIPTSTLRPTPTAFPVIIPPGVSTPYPTYTPYPTLDPTRLTPPPGPTPLPSATAGIPVISGPGTGGSGLSPGDFGGVTGLGEAVMGFATNLWTRSTIWAGQLGTTTTRVLGGWGNAVPAAPPAMPRCRTNPLANELCAIWYILQYTVFSGPIGGLIIPLATLVVDLFALFIFIRLARAIVARLGEVLRS